MPPPLLAENRAGILVQQILAIAPPKPGIPALGWHKLPGKINKPALMFDPYSTLRAKAAFYVIQQMVPLIQAGSYESAAGIYNAGNPRFRSSYTRNVAADTLKWIPVFKA